jgi:hypothetical protein
VTARRRAAPPRTPAGPAFVKPFRLLYNFEKLQHMRLVVVDIDKGHAPDSVDPARCVSCRLAAAAARPSPGALHCCCYRCCCCWRAAGALPGPAPVGPAMLPVDQWSSGPDFVKAGR